MRPRNPLVSIVIPVYNGANYLREAIESALAQTYGATEVIVVNDGSSDGGRTRDVAASFGRRIRYFEKENGGVATALNLGIREMRGEYFSWLSHDDLYDREKVDRQWTVLQALGDDTAIPFCNHRVIDEAARVRSVGSLEASLRANSILLVVGTHINGCSLLVPRAAFDAAGPFNERLRNTQDNELWLRMVMKGYRFHYMPDVLIQSRLHPGQTSRTDNARQVEESRAFYGWALEFIGRENRVVHAAGLFRILLAKRQWPLVTRFARRLSADRSLVFALSSLLAGAFRMSTDWIFRRLKAVPGAVWLKPLVRKARFQNSARYWQRRYERGETSGTGSYGKFAEYKAGVLNRFVTDRGITRVAEFGCGDGNQLEKFQFKRYLGIDVAPAAVERCRTKYGHDRTKRFLVHTGADTVAAIREFGPELTLSLDVIYHLVEDPVFEEHIHSLFRLSSRYVIVYSSNVARRHDAPHQVDRRFTDYVEERIHGWNLIDVVVNPHKGAETQSDFYIYEKSASHHPGPGEAAES